MKPETMPLNGVTADGLVLITASMTAKASVG